MTELYWSDFVVKDPPDGNAPFRDIFTGEGEFKVWRRCGWCFGRGHLRGTDQTCPRCGGTKGRFLE